MPILKSQEQKGTSLYTSYFRSYLQNDGTLKVVDSCEDSCKVPL